jgi:hypothetical protein
LGGRSEESLFSSIWLITKADIVWILEDKKKNNSKNHSSQTYLWQFGQKWVPRPAKRMRRMGASQRRQGKPVRR